MCCFLSLLSSSSSSPLFLHLFLSIPFSFHRQFMCVCALPLLRRQVAEVGDITTRLSMPVMDARNRLAIVWAERKEFDKALAMLHSSQDLYHEVKQRYAVRFDGGAPPALFPGDMEVSREETDAYARGECVGMSFGGEAVLLRPETVLLPVGARVVIIGGHQMCGREGRVHARV